MRSLLSLALACCIASAFAADIPVAEIKLGQDARQHAQLKTDFAFKEMQRADDGFVDVIKLIAVVVVVVAPEPRLGVLVEIIAFVVVGCGAQHTAWIDV